MGRLSLSLSRSLSNTCIGQDAVRYCDSPRETFFSFSSFPFRFGKCKCDWLGTWTLLAERERERERECEKEKGNKEKESKGPTGTHEKVIPRVLSEVTALRYNLDDFLFSPLSVPSFRTKPYFILSFWKKKNDCSHYFWCHFCLDLTQSLFCQFISHFSSSFTSTTERKEKDRTQWTPTSWLLRFDLQEWFVLSPSAHLVRTTGQRLRNYFHTIRLRLFNEHDELMIFTRPSKAWPGPRWIWEQMKNTRRDRHCSINKICALNCLRADLINFQMQQCPLYPSPDEREEENVSSAT